MKDCEIVSSLTVITKVGSGAMWMAKLQILAKTPHNLEVEGSGRLKPVPLLRKGQARAPISAYTATELYYRMNELY